MELNEYQQHANATAIYPRLFTEEQVVEIINYMSGQIEALGAVEAPFFSCSIEEAMSAVETPFNRLVYPILGLVGEAGEMANKLKKVARDDGGDLSWQGADDLLKEDGDCLWYVAAIASELRVPLETVAEDNVAKLLSRQERGVLSGSGDHR